MQCPHRLLLERKYLDARATFDAAVEKLQRRIGISLKDEYMQLSADLKSAWRIVELRRDDVERHTNQHCCLTLGSKLPL